MDWLLVIMIVCFAFATFVIVINVVNIKKHGSYSKWREHEKQEYKLRETRIKEKESDQLEAIKKIQTWVGDESSTPPLKKSANDSDSYNNHTDCDEVVDVNNIYEGANMTVTMTVTSSIVPKIGTFFRCSSKKPELETWAQWSNSHNSRYYQQRDAISANLLYLDDIELIAYFVGGANSYVCEASLDVCTCDLFNKDFLPCKHMYRLFYEIEHENIPISSKFPNFTLDTLYTLSTLSRELVYKFFSIIEFIEHQGYYYSPKCDVMQELLSLELISEIECKNYEHLLTQYTHREILEDLQQANISGFAKSWKKAKLISWLAVEHLDYLKKQYKAIYGYCLADSLAEKY